MPTRKRKSLEDISHDFQQFLYYRDQSATQGKVKEKFAKKLRDYCKTHGVIRKDDDGQEISGNIEYHLSEPVYVGDKAYTGFELRRQGGPGFDEDAARKLAAEKGMEGDVLQRTITLREKDYQQILQELGAGSETLLSDAAGETSVDQEAFYVAYQKNKLTEAEIDSLLVEPESPRYAFWPIESSGGDSDE